MEIGDIVKSRSGCKFSVLSKGSSFGYNIKDLKYGKVCYDVDIVKDKGSFVKCIWVRSSFSDIKIGDTKKMLNGEICSVYKKSSDGTIDLQFEDGNVLSFSSYNAFVKGYATSDRTEGKKFDFEIGDIITVSGGLKGKIIELSPTNLLVDVGGVVCNFSLLVKRKGSFILPKKDIEKILVGKSKILDNGMTAKIIKTNGLNELTVELSNGEIFEKIRYGNFIKRGSFHKRALGERIYQEIEKDYATVIGYKKDKILVEFSDGTKVYTYIRTFRNGRVKKVSKVLKHVVVGGKVVQKSGFVAEVISKNSDRSINVRLSNGDVFNNIPTHAYRKGYVSSTGYKSLNDKFADKYCCGYTNSLYGFKFRVVSIEKGSVVLEWNDCYTESVKRSSIKSNMIPKIFTNKAASLRYKDIVVDRFECSKDSGCFIVYGTCRKCGKSMVCSTLDGYSGHNCLEGVTKDYFGVDVSVTLDEHCDLIVNYEDGTSRVLCNAESLLVHPKLKTKGGAMSLSEDKKSKVRSMYYDKSLKRYVCVVEKDKKRFLTML